MSIQRYGAKGHVVTSPTGCKITSAGRAMDGATTVATANMKTSRLIILVSIISVSVDNRDYTPVRPKQSTKSSTTGLT